MLAVSNISAPQFAVGWLAAAAASAGTDLAPALGDAVVVTIGAIDIPVITCLLGALGIIAARPLAKKKEAQIGWSGFLLVSLIMLVLVELWIIESNPRWLFAFVVAIGLGFSGYSLIEIAGSEASGMVKRMFQIATGSLDRDANTPKDKD